MFKSKKIAGFFLSLSILGSAAVFAQTQQLPQQQQQPVEVSDAELEKFANAFQQVRVITMEAQQEMAGVVTNEGMDIQRFNEIHEAVLNPEVEVTATEDEKKQHGKIISELETIQAGVQAKMEKAVQDQGITPARYEQIAMGLQNDPKLQERVKKIFQS
ncbi:MAG TPA: DUF4168 domain-containing protein [Gillisia sp.]|nr:DUF4168 domain-containing protein [Gillisia sp.]